MQMTFSFISCSDSPCRVASLILLNIRISRLTHHCSFIIHLPIIVSINLSILMKGQQTFPGAQGYIFTLHVLSDKESTP